MPLCVTTPTDAVALDCEVGRLLLKQRQISLRLEHAANRTLVELPIGLRARRAHRRTLAQIQGAELDARLIGGEGHRPAQRIDLLDQMALADAADRGIATHLPQRLDVVRQQQSALAHARSRKSGLGACMPTADDDHSEFRTETH